MSMLKLNLGVVALVMGLTLGFVLGIVRPGLRELKASQAQITDKQAKVGAQQNQLGNIGNLYASIVQLDEEMRDFRVRLPAERRFGEFLNDLSERLKKCKIDDYAVQPRPALRVDGSKLPATMKLAAGTTILPVGISFRGSFRQMFDFLEGMESLQRLSRVESIKVVNDQQHPGEVTVELTLHTYQHSAANENEDPARGTNVR
jgi:Tfp pilus assembly protein PilO